MARRCRADPKIRPNLTSAKALLTRIENSILEGTWRELKKELAGGQKRIWTVGTFYECFMEEYCKTRMRSWDRYRLSFQSLNRTLGDIPLREFRRSDLHRYVAERNKVLKPATVNRDIAACKKMFTYALECGVIDVHPLTRFPRLKRTQEGFSAYHS